VITRHFAANHGCPVVGVDLTDEFVAGTLAPVVLHCTRR
jgi:hypothetical protein